MKSPADVTLRNDEGGDGGHPIDSKEGEMEKKQNEVAPLEFRILFDSFFQSANLVVHFATYLNTVIS